jgi:DNA-binding response OmpR family regulator
MGVSDPRPVVVLADDDDAITSNLAAFLDRAGFTVHVAADGDAALELVERLDPDGCVLDVLMPGPDGREVLRPACVAQAAGCPWSCSPRSASRPSGPSRWMRARTTT